MISDLYVWVWLPGQTQPVVAGRLRRRADGTTGFLYGQSYLARNSAIALYAPELPLRPGEILPQAPMALASCIRDGAPDAWGRRVILNRLIGRHAGDDLDELTFLAESGSDRIGALDFQHSATDYNPRTGGDATLGQLQDAAGYVERGDRLPPDLEVALNHGTSIGGARPKALLSEGGTGWVAKFSLQNDIFSVVGAEFLAMRLAAHAGLNVATVRLAQAGGRDVLLVRRFDRVSTPEGAQTRRAIVSALTILGLDEMEARYASYAVLAETVRKRFTSAPETLRELFGRAVFNVLSGNTDDHARNHAAFWDGHDLTLTPAYDLCPQQRTGGEASQAMIIQGDDRRAQVAVCLDAAGVFGLSRADARRVVAGQIDIIATRWQALADEAGLTPVDRAFFAGRQFLNPYAFERLDGDDAALATAAAAAAQDMRR